MRTYLQALNGVPHNHDGSLPAAQQLRRWREEDAIAAGARRPRGPGPRLPLSRRIRAAGFSVAQVAKELGVVEASVFFWASGRARPRHHHREALAQLLGCQVTDLEIPAPKRTEA